jgi:hypothetical protein
VDVGGASEPVGTEPVREKIVFRGWWDRKIEVTLDENRLIAETCFGYLLSEEIVKDFMGRHVLESR